MTNPTITNLPPVPTRNDAPAAFVDKADAFLGALPQFQAEANALSAAVEADTAQTAADRVQTGLDRASATASASSALNAPGSSGTSTTSLLIGAGTKSFTTQAGKAWSVGQGIVIASTASPLNQMSGVMTAYNASTGAMTVEVSTMGGSGTFAAWTISLTAGAAMAVASQAEAEAGTDPSRVMTPLRTAQAVAIQAVPTGGAIKALASPGPRYVLANGGSYSKTTYPALAAIMGDRYASWTSTVVNLRAGYEVRGIYSEPGLAIATGTNGAIWTTTDGLTFTERATTMPNFSYGYGAIKAANKYFLYGFNTSTTLRPLVSSANGTTGWTDVASFASFSSGHADILAMAYGTLGGTPTIVAIGGGGNGATGVRLRYSTDEGATWSDGATVGDAGVSGPATCKVMIANGVVTTVVAVPQRVRSGSSPATMADVTGIGTILSIDLGNNLFVATSNTGAIWSSADCVAWTLRETPTGMGGVTNYVGYFNGAHHFRAAVDGQLRFYATADFVTWWRVQMSTPLPSVSGRYMPVGARVLGFSSGLTNGQIVSAAFTHNAASEFPVPLILGDAPTYIRT